MFNRAARQARRQARPIVAREPGRWFVQRRLPVAEFKQGKSTRRKVTARPGAFCSSSKVFGGLVRSGWSCGCLRPVRWRSLQAERPQRHFGCSAHEVVHVSRQFDRSVAVILLRRPPNLVEGRVEFLACEVVEAIDNRASLSRSVHESENKLRQWLVKI